MTSLIMSDLVITQKIYVVAMKEIFRLEHCLGQFHSTSRTSGGGGNGGEGGVPPITKKGHTNDGYEAIMQETPA